MINEGVFSAWFEIGRRVVGALVFAWLLARLPGLALPVAAVWIGYMRWLVRSTAYREQACSTSTMRSRESDGLPASI